MLRCRFDTHRASAITEAPKMIQYTVCRLIRNVINDSGFSTILNDGTLVFLVVFLRGWAATGLAATFLVVTFFTGVLLAAVFVVFFTGARLVVVVFLVTIVYLSFKTLSVYQHYGKYH